MLPLNNIDNKINNMAKNKKKLIAPKALENLKNFKAQWQQSEKVLLRAMVTREALEFLELMAFQDWGMMKKGAMGLELTKLILLVKHNLAENQAPE